MVNLVILLVAFSAIILLFLIFRFIQPELIYIVRGALHKVKSRKLVLDSTAYRFTSAKEFPDLLGDDLRYETHNYDEKYIFNRVHKIKKLYRILVRRPPVFRSKKHKPQACIVELAGMLENLGRHVLPDQKFSYPTVHAASLLAFIGNEMRRQSTSLPPLVDVADIKDLFMTDPIRVEYEIKNWFTTNPISIEQVIEILIAAVYGMAYRQSVQDEEGRQRDIGEMGKKEQQKIPDVDIVPSTNAPTPEGTLTSQVTPQKGETPIAPINVGSASTAYKIPISIFVSYSHNDEKYLNSESLLGALKGLESEGVEFWTDRNIKVGDSWNKEIQDKISESHIALVLVSQAFLDSAYCNVEIRRFLEEAEHRGLVIMPIMLSRCEWDRHDWLKSRQFLPSGGKTIEEDFHSPGKRKGLFHEIRQQLRSQIEIVRSKSSA